MSNFGISLVSKFDKNRNIFSACRENRWLFEKWVEIPALEAAVDELEPHFLVLAKKSVPGALRERRAQLLSFRNDFEVFEHICFLRDFVHEAPCRSVVLFPERLTRLEQVHDEVLV